MGDFITAGEWMKAGGSRGRGNAAFGNDLPGDGWGNKKRRTSTTATCPHHAPDAAPTGASQPRQAAARESTASGRGFPSRV